MAGPFTGALSAYLETGFLGHTLLGQSLTAPAAQYLSLHVSSPTDTGDTANEPSSGSYARVAVTNQFGNLATGIPTDQTSGGSVENTGVITFPVASLDWGTVSHWGIWDGNVSTSNMLYYGEFTTAKAINSGDTVQISSGSLTIELR